MKETLVNQKEQNVHNNYQTTVESKMESICTLKNRAWLSLTLVVGTSTQILIKGSFLISEWPIAHKLQIHHLRALFEYAHKHFCSKDIAESP